MAFCPRPFLPAGAVPSNPDGNHDWIVPGLIPRDGVVILASAPKTGKTCLATAIARAVATGTPFLGQPVESGPVLWCAHEETRYERAELHAGLAPDDPLYVAYTGDLPELDEPTPKSDRFGRLPQDALEAPYVFEQAADCQAALIVIDCLHAACSRGSLADNQFARFVMGRLRRWSSHFHRAVLVLHHLTKSATRGHHPERFADSAQILAAASCHFFLERQQETENDSRLTLYGRGRHPAPYSRLELVSTGPLDYRLAAEASAETRPPTIADRVLAELEGGWALTSIQIATRVRANPASVRHALAELQARSLVVPTGRERQAVRYALAAEEPS